MRVDNLMQAAVAGTAHGWHIDADRRVVIVEPDEPLTLPRLEAALGSVLRSHAFDPHFGWVEDLRSAQAVPPFRLILASIVLIDEVLGGRVKTRRWVRVVDDRRPDIFLTARRAEYVMKTVGWKSTTYCDLDQAARWAGGIRRER